MTKCALITGGNRGIGLAIVDGLSKLGYKVLLGARDTEHAEQALTHIPSQDVHVVDMDLASEQSIADHFSRAVATYGDIDILINNAGINLDEPFLGSNMQKMQESMQVHVLAPMQLTKLTLPGMLERNFGRIVNLSSGYGSFYEGLAGPLNYSTSKAALNALTVTSAKTVENTNVKINAMCPGWVHTRMGGKDAPRTPEQGADTAIWLACIPEDGPNGMFFRDRTPIKW
ncbi:SDR family NAD(P)-dependent oxidoreductase [Aestuariibacter salexigens]|uniref:SDR family NAD(P)-dependent oxidoreductase n=1 Tax=Aestuariibacter salexigens TaxID=226010 RepID=UPI00040980D2|nr:SDR family NAD(P)-dependent oxidoreductase [Aestuariibacter salexigens]